MDSSSLRPILYIVIVKFIIIVHFIMQKPGRNVEMLRHMKSQAQAQDIPPAGYCGYITFDEMSVQVILFIVLLVL